jgi:hypothetical protein
MEVYIHLLSGNDEYKPPFPAWNEVVKTNINLHSPLEMKW